MENTNSESENG